MENPGAAPLSEKIIDFLALGQKPPPSVVRREKQGRPPGPVQQGWHPPLHPSQWGRPHGLPPMAARRARLALAVESSGWRSDGNRPDVRFHTRQKPLGGPPNPGGPRRPAKTKVKTKIKTAPAPPVGGAPLSGPSVLSLCPSGSARAG